MKMRTIGFKEITLSIPNEANVSFVDNVIEIKPY